MVAFKRGAGGLRDSGNRVSRLQRLCSQRGGVCIEVHDVVERHVDDSAAGEVVRVRIGDAVRAGTSDGSKRVVQPGNTGEWRCEADADGLLFREGAKNSGDGICNERKPGAYDYGLGECQAGNIERAHFAGGDA